MGLWQFVNHLGPNAIVAVRNKLTKENHWRSSLQSAGRHGIVYICEDDIVTRIFNDMLLKVSDGLANLSKSVRKKLDLVVVVAVPLNTTPMERGAIQIAVKNALWDDQIEKFLGKVILVGQPGAALIGARSKLGSKLDFQTTEASTIVDIGGGTTDIAVVSLGEVIYNWSFELGGNFIDKVLFDYVSEVHDLEIGMLDAENIKIKLGSAQLSKLEIKGEVFGRRVGLGKKDSVILTANEIYKCLEEKVLKPLVAEIKDRLSRVDKPQIMSDIRKKGLWLSGGGSLVRKLHCYLRQELGLPVHRVKNPLTAVIDGIEIMLADENLLDRFNLNRLGRIWDEEDSCQEKIQKPAPAKALALTAMSSPIAQEESNARGQLTSVA
jgi:actin-like ATPase involved in cell morphogenesis